MTETIIVNGEPHQIDAKRATLVFNAGGHRIQYPGRVMITAEMSLNRYREIDEIDQFAAAMFEMVIPDFGRQVCKAELDQCSDGLQQLAGLLSLTVWLLSRKHAIGWSYPESGLHPKYQANLADVIIMLTDSEAIVRFVRRVAANTCRVDKSGYGNADIGG